jgi:hypothetical protein
MAPVSLEAFGEPEDTMTVRPSRGRRALYTVMGLTAVSAIGFLALTMAKHPPPPQAPETTAAAVVAAPPAAVPTPPPAVTSAATTPDATAASTPVPAATVAAASTTTTKATKKKASFAPSRAHASPQAPAAAPVVIPKAHAAPAGDSLMDLIKKSVASGK